MIQFSLVNKISSTSWRAFSKEEEKFFGIFWNFLGNLPLLKKKSFGRRKLYSSNDQKNFYFEGCIIFFEYRLKPISFLWKIKQFRKLDFDNFDPKKFFLPWCFFFRPKEDKKKIQDFAKTEKLKNFLFWQNIWKKLLFFYNRKLLLNGKKFFDLESLGPHLRTKMKSLFQFNLDRKNSSPSFLKREIISKIKYITERHSEKKILWIRLISLEKIQNNIERIKKLLGTWVQKDFLSKNLNCIELCLNLFEILNGNPGKINFAIVNSINKELNSVFQSLFKKVPIEIEKILSFSIWNKNFFFNLEFLKITSLNDFSDLSRKLFQKSILYSYGGQCHDLMLLQWAWLECKNGSLGVSCKIEFSLKGKTLKIYPNQGLFFLKLKKHKKWKVLFYVLKKFYRNTFFRKILEKIDQDFFTEKTEKMSCLKRNYLFSRFI